MLMRRTGYLKDNRYRLESKGVYLYVSAVILFCWVALCYFALVREQPLEPLSQATDVVAPFWSSICHFFSNPYPLITYAAGFLLMLVEAYMLYVFTVNQLLLRQAVRLPFFLCLLLQSACVRYLPLPVTSFCFLPFLLLMYMLFSSFRTPANTMRAYRMALLFGILSFFWAPILWFVPIFWWNMYRFRTMSTRVIVVLFLGLTSIYWIVFGWCFWRGDYSLLKYPIRALADIHLPQFAVDARMLPMAFLLLSFGLLTLFSVGRILWTWTKEDVQRRFNLSFLMQYLLTCGVLLCLYGQYLTEVLHLLCIPVPMLVTHSLSLHHRVLRWCLFLVTVAVFAALFALWTWRYL